jgi:hypothetical protein
MSELIDNINVKVDASLLVYNEETEELEQTMMLATDLLNTGFAQVQLPTSPVFPTSRYDVHATVLQLSVNTSTTIMPVNKRAAHRFILRSVLQLAKKFTKLTPVSIIKRFVARRLNCEVWAATTPRVPRRSIPPCPCTTGDAASDTRYVEDEAPEYLRRFFHKGSSICYRQASATVRYN